MSSTSLPEDLLLAECSALAALARQLTRDPHAAADAVQDTLLTALLRPPPPAAHARSWLAAVLRNVLRQHRRAGGRRQAMHAALPAPPPSPSAAAVCEELELHRQLLAMVQRLEPSCRQVLFLRFWRGLSAREVGAALGLPVTTVQGRLERGLRQLRSQLDARHGGRRGWLALLIGHAPDAAPALTFGGCLLMKTKLLVALLAVTMLWVLLPMLQPAAESAPVAAPAPLAAATAPAADLQPAASMQRQALPPAAPPPAEASPPLPMLAGIVLDLHGNGIAGVEVCFERETAAQQFARDRDVAPAISGADGGFDIAFGGRAGWLTVADARWTAVRRPWLGRELPAEPAILVVAPSRSYRGTVVDPDGAPVAGARVVVQVADTLLPARAVAANVVALPNDLATASTDAQGRFTFERLGFVAGARLIAERAPFAAATLALPEASTADLLLRLAPPDGERRLYGVVVDASGRPVAEALVSVGNESVATAADGRFAVPWAYRQRPTVVRAVRTDLGVASLALAAGPGQPGETADRPLTLQLQPPLELRGSVVDADGAPVAGAIVWTPELTWLGNVTLSEHGHEWTRPASVEGMATAVHARLGMQATLAITTTTAADGSFVLHGLLPRPYAVFALAERTLLGAGPVPARPGDELQLQLAAAPLQRLAGTVRSRDGQPLAGVAIHLGRTLPWTPPAGPDDAWAGSPMLRSKAAHLSAVASATTDADGHFAIDGVQVQGAFLHCDGEAVFASAPFELDAAQTLDRLDVRVDARSTYRIELQDPGEADAFKVCGEGGRHVSLFVRVENAVMSMGAVDLVGGRSPLASSPAGEVTVVLLRQGREVRRAQVVLPAGGPHTLRP